MPTGWRVSDEIREASRVNTLAEHPVSEDLWSFGYGSLIWDLGFPLTKSESRPWKAISDVFACARNLAAAHRNHPG